MSVKDPDRSRLLLASRATLSALSTTVVLWLAGKWLGLPFHTLEVMLGSAMAMMSTLAVGGSLMARGQRRKAFAVLLAPMLTSLVVGTWLSPHPQLSLTVFVGVVFLSVWAQRFGPRGVGIGLMVFNGYFFSLFFHAHLAVLPALMAAATVGVGLALAVATLLLPDRPHRVVARSNEALVTRTTLVLEALAKEFTGPGRSKERVRRHLRALNEAILSFEEHLERAPQARLSASREELRQRMLELEVSVGRVVANARSIGDELGDSQEAWSRLRNVVTLAARAVEGDGEAEVPSRAACASLAPSAPEERPRLAVSVERVGVTLISLFHAAGALRAATEPPKDLATVATGLLRPVSFRGAALSRDSLESFAAWKDREEPVEPSGASAAAPSAGLPGREPGESSGTLAPSTRLAIQASVASAISLFVGRWIAEDRWFWAVLAAYIVIAPATTRGEILVRAWHRTLGTVAGVGLGLVLAVAIQGHPWLELGLLFVCIFLGLYALKTSYTVMVLWFTALLAVLYSWMGQYSAHVMLIRLLETGAGAAVGALVSVFVLPSRTGLKVRRALERELGAFEECLRHFAAFPGVSATFMLAAARDLDRALRDVRQAAEPYTRSRFRIAPETLALVHGASLLAFYTRQLSHRPLWNTTRNADTTLRLLQTLSANSVTLRRALGGEKGGALVDVSSLILAEHRRAVETPAEKGQHDAALVALWFERLDDALTQMGSALKLKSTPDAANAQPRVETKASPLPGETGASSEPSQRSA